MAVWMRRCRLLLQKLTGHISEVSNQNKLNFGLVWFVYGPNICANFQRNLRGWGFFVVDLVWNDPNVPNSIAKAFNSITKATNWSTSTTNSTANPTNLTATAPNSTANRTKSTAMVTNSIAKICIKSSLHCYMGVILYTLLIPWLLGNLLILYIHSPPALAVYIAKPLTAMEQLICITLHQQRPHMLGPIEIWGLLLHNFISNTLPVLFPIQKSQ